MPVTTLFSFLIGSRAAILRIAGHPHALWIGALLVLSAALAREYDGEYLLREPWHLGMSFAASLAASFILFCLLYLAMLRHIARGQRPPFWRGYGAFLGVFWMTAPLAWLYGIPYERWLEPAAAVEANLWTLGVVAGWRVLLTLRVVTVLFGASLPHASSLVLLFSDVLMLSAIQFVPLPILNLMGGIRLGEADALLAGTALILTVYGSLALPVFGLGALAVLLNKAPWQAHLPATPDKAPAGRLALLAAAACALFVALLPFTQAEQALRYQAEHLLRAGDLEAALALMSAHRREEFPPLWDPPPRPAYRETEPDILEVWDLMEKHPPAPWVKTLWLDKVFHYSFMRYFYRDDFPLSNRQLQRLVEETQAHPDAARWIMEYRQIIRHHMDSSKDEERKRLFQRFIDGV